MILNVGGCGGVLLFVKLVGNVYFLLVMRWNIYEMVVVGGFFVCIDVGYCVCVKLDFLFW